MRSRKFTLLWGGLLVSIAGSQMQVWALYWHVRDLSSQPIALGLMGLMRFVPIIVFSLFGGYFSDRFNRRKVLFFSQSAQTLVALTLGLLTLLGKIQLWHIYLLTACQATAVSFDQPARQALVPLLVDKAVLPSAFSMQSIAVKTGAIIGPALAGVVIASLGTQWVYWLNAISFMAVILALILMGPIAQERNLITDRFSFRQIAEGVRFTFSRSIILSSTILDFFATFFSSAKTLLPYVARDILHVGVIEYGWLSAAQAIGSVSVGLFLSQRTRIRHQGRILLVSACLFGIGTIVFGVSHAFWLTMAALIIAGGADTLSAILRNTIRQLQTPDHLRGRMVSVTQIFYTGGPQLGEIESGVVAQLFTVPIAIISGGIGCLLAVVGVMLKWPSLARFDGSEEPEEIRS